MATKVKKTNNPEDLVDLYYLGGLDRNKPGKGRVTSWERAFALPKVGEALRIERRYAEDLMRKHKYMTADGEYVGVFTLNARIAQRVRDGMNPLKAYQTQKQFTDLTDEQILELARERGLVGVEEDKETPKPAKTQNRSEKPAAKAQGAKKTPPKKAEPQKAEPESDPIEDNLNGLSLE